MLISIFSPVLMALVCYVFGAV